MGNFNSTTNLPNNVEVSEVFVNDTPGTINSKDIYKNTCENNKLDIPVNEKNIDIQDNSDYGLSLESDYGLSLESDYGLSLESDYGLSLESDYELNSIKTEESNEIYDNCDYNIADDNIDDEFRKAVYEYFKNKKLKKIFSNKQKFLENVDDLGVYSTYSVEFGTKSKTRRIIENLI